MNFEAALGLYQSLDDAGGQASAMINIGVIHSRAHDPSKALEVLNSALELAKSLSDKSLEAGCLNAIGQAYASLGDRGRALESYNSALSEFRQIGNPGANAEVIRNIELLSAGKSR